MSTPNLNDLDPESPEYEAALQAAQRAEDEAIGNAIDEPSTEQTDAPTDDAPADDTTQSTTTTAPAAGADDKGAPAAEKPAGVLSKDGTKVLPYAALRGARQEAKAHREAREAAEARAAALEQQLADALAGKKPAKAEDEDLTPDRIEEIVADYPSLAPLVKKFADAQDQLKKLTATAAPAPAAAEDEDGDDIQDAIDSIPLLATWQSSKAEAPKWQRAVAIDKVLLGSPKWANKPEAERLKEVTRMVADEFDIPFQDDDDTPSPQDKTPGKNSRQPVQQVISNARRMAPNTLSDFKGGNPDPSGDPIERLPAQRQLARVEEMTDEQIEAWVRKTGG